MCLLYTILYKGFKGVLRDVNVIVIATHNTHIWQIFILFPWVQHICMCVKKKRDKLADAVANMKYAREHRIALCGD